MTLLQPVVPVLQNSGIPSDHNSSPLANWRVCSYYKYIKDGDSRLTIDLAINSYSGIVMGFNHDGSMVRLPTDLNLTGKIDVGAQIKIARIQRGLTMASLARMLGVSPQAVRYWESGIRRPRYHKVQHSIETVLGVHIPIAHDDIE